MKSLPIVRNLPAALVREVGRIVTAHSYLEVQLMGIVYVLLGVGSKEGRLAVREPRIGDIVDMIRKISDVHGLPVKIDMKSLGAELKRLSSERDLVAHGVWVAGPGGTLFIRRVKGDWQPTKGMRGSISRMIKPEGIKFDTDECSLLHAAIVAASVKVEALRAEIHAALASSPRKPK